MQKKYAIGIDLGGTNLRAALVSHEGNILKRIHMPSLNNVEAALLDAVSEVFIDGVTGIGIGVAGLINREYGTVFISPNLPAVENFQISKTLNSRFRVPVVIENDANVAALGEKWAGSGGRYDDFVHLTLGTGIGGGIIYKGALLNVSAELGHMSIIANGRRCSCGNNGCLEAYASARAIVMQIIKTIEDGSASLLKEYHNGNLYKLTAEDIYKAALDGDSLSGETLRDAGRYLGIGAANIINIFSPQAIIFSGGLTGAWDIYVQEAIKEASKRSIKQLFERVEIIPSSLDDNAGIIGAAYLVFNAD